jgi:hypothetical protein
MYQLNSIIHTCTNIYLTFPFFEFRPPVQNPVPTFKPASHPVITCLFAIVIGKPPFFQFFARSLPAFVLLLPISHQQNALRNET